MARRAPGLLLLAAWCLALIGCEAGDALQRARDEGRLLILTRNSPTTYYVDRGEAAGFEWELGNLFAEELGVRLQVDRW